MKNAYTRSASEHSYLFAFAFLALGTLSFTATLLCLIANNYDLGLPGLDAFEAIGCFAVSTTLLVVSARLADKAEAQAAQEEQQELLRQAQELIKKTRATA